MAPGGIQHPGRAVRQGGLEDQCWEDSWNGLPPVPGGGNAFGGGIRETDDGSRYFLPGEAEGSGTLHRVRIGDGAQVAVGTHADAAW